MVKLIYSNYDKEYLEQVSINAVQLNADEKVKLLSILNEYDDLFDGTIG